MHRFLGVSTCFLLQCWRMKTSFELNNICMKASKNASVCAHTCCRMSACRDWVLRTFLWGTVFYHLEGGTAVDAGPQDNVRERRGQTPSSAHFLSHLFLAALRRCGCTLHRTANKIRLWGGPHPSGSLCVFGTDLVIEKKKKLEENF